MVSASDSVVRVQVLAREIHLWFWAKCIYFILTVSQWTEVYKWVLTLQCADVSENIHTPPHRRDWNFLGVGGSVRPKNLKKCMKFNWNFQRGGGSMVEVWIFSRITQWTSIPSRGE